MFNFGIQLGILLLATLVFGVFPLHAELLYFIPGLALILVYGTALALILSAANVFLRDIQYLIEVIVMLLMWASPIVYSWDMVKETVPPVAPRDLHQQPDHPRGHGVPEGVLGDRA